MEYILETKSLTKKYRNFYALKNLNMRIEKGAIYGFIGRNGAGKTTLIRVVCGLQKETAGEYSLFGKFGKDIQAEREKLSGVVETPSIYLGMTAYENLKMQYKTLGIPSFDGIDDLLKTVGLSNTGKKKAKNFSLGMKQRLGIAVSLAGNPDLLLLDEPINGLDPQGIVEIRELILKLNKEKGLTILISSHILGELSKMATHYGFINKGSMIAEMSAEELFNKCRKCTKLEVTDVKSLCIILDGDKKDYKVLSNDHVEVYGEIQVTDLAIKLQKHGCDIVKITENDEDLESFYINLVGGIGNE